MMVVQRWQLSAWPPVSEREVLRYAQWAGAGEISSPALTSLVERAEGKLSRTVAWAVFPVQRIPEGLDLGFAQTASRDLARSLEGCAQVLAMAATLGLALDREIARSAVRSPSEALLLHALGAERIEALCDAFCTARGVELAEEGLRLHPRFSPGYGDLPLALQQPLFAALDCERQLGLTLNPSLLMTPSKSVTALAGISRVKEE